MKLTASALALAVICTPALAADLPSQLPPAPPVYPPALPAAYNWTGFYIGANGGYAFSNSDTTTVVSGTVLGGRTLTDSGSSSAATAGGQVGANYQINAFVLGIEGDFDWSGQESNQSESCGVGCGINSSAKIEWLATLRGRLGFAIDRALIYGTGGVAWTDASQNVTAIVAGTSTTLLDASSVNVGWTIGGGLEMAVTQNLTAKAEYFYIQTNGSLSGGVGVIGGTATTTGTIKDNVVRVGLNLKYP